MYVILSFSCHLRSSLAHYLWMLSSLFVKNISKLTLPKHNNQPMYLAKEIYRFSKYLANLTFQENLHSLFLFANLVIFAFFSVKCQKLDNQTDACKNR